MHAYPGNGLAAPNHVHGTRVVAYESCSCDDTVEGESRSGIDGHSGRGDGSKFRFRTLGRTCAYLSIQRIAKITTVRRAGRRSRVRSGRRISGELQVHIVRGVQVLCDLKDDDPGA